MTEKSFSHKIGFEKVIYKAYKIDQIKAILSQTLSECTSGISVFEDDALTYAARKTASGKGDIRKAFQLCKLAIDIAISKNGTNPVSMHDILAASHEMEGSTLIRAAKSCTGFEALVLISLSSIRRQTGRSDCTIQNLLQKMNGIATAFGDDLYLPCPSFGETLELLMRMSETCFVTMITPKPNSIKSVFSGNTLGMNWPLVRLNLDDHDLSLALSDSEHAKMASKHGVCF